MRDKASWSTAKSMCKTIGASLVSITSSDENNFIKSFISKDSERAVWIGLRRNGESWKWADGSRFSYRNWHQGEPNDSFWNGGEDCVNINAKTGNNWANTVRWTRGKWEDSNCSKKNHFICKKAKDMTSQLM
ncbi:C-type lectin lectoxin-Lio2-like [Branchiostoma floridae x Branchiostoma japonicum]